MLMARVGERLQGVLGVRGRIDDVVAGQLAVEHAEAVVVLARDGDVLHPGPLGGLDPRLGVEGRRVEPRGELLVFGDGDLVLVHDPFPLAQEGIDAPMDEEAEPGIREPSSRLRVGRAGLLRAGRCRRPAARGSRRGGPSTSRSEASRCLPSVWSRGEGLRGRRPSTAIGPHSSTIAAAALPVKLRPHFASPSATTAAGPAACRRDRRTPGSNGLRPGARHRGAPGSRARS